MSGIAPKKPGIPDPKDPTFLGNVKNIIEIMLGRRGNKITRLNVKLLSASASPPTQAEYNALALQVEILQDTVNQLIDRFDA